MRLLNSNSFVDCRTKLKTQIQVADLLKFEIVSKKDNILGIKINYNKLSLKIYDVNNQPDNEEIINQNTIWLQNDQNGSLKIGKICYVTNNTSNQYGNTLIENILIEFQQR